MHQHFTMRLLVGICYKQESEISNELRNSGNIIFTKKTT